MELLKGLFKEVGDVADVEIGQPIGKKIEDDFDFVSKIRGTYGDNAEIEIVDEDGEKNIVARLRMLIPGNKK